MKRYSLTPRTLAVVLAAVLAAVFLARDLLPQSLLEVWSFGTSSFMLRGAWTAIQIALLSLVLGLVFGLMLALMRLSSLAPLRSFAWFYIWFLRGTPLILQIVFLFDALPAVGIKLDSFTTAVLGFTLNEAAFCAEIIRGGIISVDRRQTQAAAAFGMGPVLSMRRIVLPQAMRVILPGLGNQAISLVKGTSIASVIFVNELTFRSQQIVGQNFKFFTVFAAAGVLYLLMTSAIGIAVTRLERAYSLDRDRGSARSWASRFGRKGGSGVAPNPLVEASAAAADADRIGSWIGQLRNASGTADRESAGVAGPARLPANAPYVSCWNVQKSYGEREILRSIDLTVAAGEVVVLMGPSGSGKSTLLRLVNHLEQMDWGEIKVDGSYVGYEKGIGGGLRPTGRLAQARAKARIGMVFQHFNLFDHLTALENIMEAPIRVHGEDPETARRLALDLLELVGLARHADHLPHRLSGGQQQRVAIARALAISPSLMLFDEPTSALDPELVGEVLAVIRRLAKAGMTMMIVTHEVRFAREVADRIVFMDEGMVVEAGPPAQVLDAPTHERTRRFLRLVEGEAAEAA